MRAYCNNPRTDPGPDPNADPGSDPRPDFGYDPGSVLYKTLDLYNADVPRHWQKRSQKYHRNIANL
ncbi:MAG: hypothetical protein RLZZ435_2932 [Cyanobacteriota bacterium]